MNKTSNDSTTVSLHQTFWRWFSFSVLALIVAAAIPALSADVFIDEGDGDFAPTPVTSSAPAAPLVVEPHVVGDKAPASTNEVPPANPASDIDSAIGSLEPAQDAIPTEPMGDTATPVTADVMPLGAPTDAPKAEGKKAAKKKHLQAVKTAKSSKKEKKADKKSSKKTAEKKKKKEGKEKKTAAKKSKKKSLTDSSKSSKRGVASITKYAGGQYATTSKSCSMESAPGAGDAVGTTVSGRKLWVEESGNTSYWKVYGKSGAAAFVSRDCF